MLSARFTGAAGVLAMLLVAGAACEPDFLEPNRPAVGSVHVEPSDPSLMEGSTARLTATVSDGEGRPLRDREVFWSSESPDVAEVSSDGTVTGRRAGTARVAASSEGKFAIVTVRVLPVGAARLEVSPALVTIEKRETVQLVATLYDAAGNVLTGREVEWTSSRPSVASVNGQGRVRGNREGVAIITARAEGLAAHAAVVVEDDD